MYRTDLLKAKKAITGKSNETLATETGLDVMTISEIMRGVNRNFGIFTLNKVAKALGLTMSDLFSSKEIEKTL